MNDHGLMNTYGRLPVTFERGEGVRLFDTDGKTYLDALSGIAVTGLGHAHPAITKTLQAQATKLLHVSNLYHIQEQERASEALLAASGMDRAFFCNSGAEANEAAIKLARLHGHRKGIQEPAIIVMEGSFHGRTLATLSASGNRKIQAGFEPLVNGFVRAPYNDLEALKHIAANNPRVVAVLVEPVQGEGGVRVPDSGYLAGLRKLCDAHGWWLMLDEVQTGNGRTGSYFACQQLGVMPDVITTAKGLGNGVPIGACLGHGEAATAFGPGQHGSTFGGNPLACAVAHTVITTIENEQLTQQAAQQGEWLRQGLRQRLANVPGIVTVRGWGQMTGIELSTPCTELVKIALAEGLLINVTHEKTIRLLPSLIFSQAETEELVDRLCPLIEQFATSKAA
ncbi:MAG: aspartate aminotransferase family protein [Gammaproteobacteria bacterium]|nr:MAG: aspartate aminotransferase family protein [Gammaproteobacteria bacterium]